MKLLSVKDVAEITNIPLGTLRLYIRTGKSPFKFRRLPSGKIVISEGELKSGIGALPDYTSTNETAKKAKTQKNKSPQH